MGGASSAPSSPDLTNLSNIRSSSSDSDRSSQASPLARRKGKLGSNMIASTIQKKSEGPVHWTEGSWKKQSTAMCSKGSNEESSVEWLSRLDPSTPALVMLGRGGVGKSTISKQVAMAFGNGTSDNEMKRNIQALIRSLVGMMNDISQMLMSEENVSDDVVALLDDLADHAGTVNWDSLFEPKIFQKGLTALWNEKIIRETAARLREVPSTRETSMMYSNAFICVKYMDKIFDEGFVIDHDDFIALRDPTSKVSVTVGNVNSVGFQLVDVGGQIHLQQEWNSIVRQFQRNCALLFVVSMVDYSHEMSDGNAMELSIHTWRSLWANKKLSGIPTILILNKMDLFMEEVKKFSLSLCPVLKDRVKPISEYKSVEDFQNSCKGAIIQLFEEIHKELWQERSPMQDACNRNFMYHCSSALDHGWISSVISKIIGSLNQRDLASFLTHVKK